MTMWVTHGSTTKHVKHMDRAEFVPVSADLYILFTVATACLGKAYKLHDGMLGLIIG
jgi:hypothetical protein